MFSGKVNDLTGNQLSIIIYRLLFISNILDDLWTCDLEVGVDIDTDV